MTQTLPTILGILGFGLVIITTIAWSQPPWRGTWICAGLLFLYVFAVSLLFLSAGLV